MHDLQTELSDHDHILGALAAPVSLVSYLDLQQDDSITIAQEIRKLIQDDEDSIQYIVRFYPQSDEGMRLARALEASDRQGKFWELYDILISTPGPKDLETIAEKIQLDIHGLTHDMASQEVIDKVEEDMTSAQINNVVDIPTLFINSDLYEGSGQEDQLKEQVFAILMQSDLVDRPLIDVAQNSAIDYQKDEPIAYVIDPMPEEEEGYTTYEDDNHLYKPLKPGMTLNESEPSIYDQDFSDPLPEIVLNQTATSMELFYTFFMISRSLYSMRRLNVGCCCVIPLVIPIFIFVFICFLFIAHTW